MVKRRTQKKAVKPKKYISQPIPKKLHFIWLGPKQPPYLEKFMKTFEAHAPGYKQRLWRDDDITKKNFPITYDTIKKVREYQGDKIKEYTNKKTKLKTNAEPKTYIKYDKVAERMRYEIVKTKGV